MKRKIRKDEWDRLNPALRVLTAVTQYREPEETDMETLRFYVPHFKDLPSDQLAYEVIRQVYEARSKTTDRAKRAEGA